MNDIGYNCGGALVAPERKPVFAAHAFIGGEFDYVGIVKNRL